ncbi:MAG: hypothetical protein Kow0020_00230 [Wenzhouxiangellaceae bacterium]
MSNRYVIVIVCLASVLLASVSQALTRPNRITVVVPAGTNNPIAPGTYTCRRNGSGTNPLRCNNNNGLGVIVDDLYLDTIRFDGTTFNANQIIPGMAALFLSGGGGTNVNAEWGDSDDNSDGDDDPFDKAGYPIPPYNQESSNVMIIDATLRQVFRTLNLVEGTDGEDQNFRLQMDLESGVQDNNGTQVDSIPEIIVFERGLNSDVAVQLLLADGGVSDELTVSSGQFRDIGFNIDTIEIGGGGQELGVVGIDLNEFSGAGFDPAADVVVGLRFGSAGGGADIFGIFGLSGNPIPLYDLGDAPSAYPVVFSAGGPRHRLDNDLYFGFPPDQEADGQPSANVDGDGADELGSLEFPGSTDFIPGQNFELDLLVTNLTGAPALACGWIDFNTDNEFDNVDTTQATTNAERACNTVPNGSVSTGDNPSKVRLTFRVPNDLNQSHTGAFVGRFRITSDWTTASQATPTGPVSNGEVEDHALNANPLPVSISYFHSRATRGGLEVSWTTVAETRNAGYEIWGDRGRGLERLNTGLIPSRIGDPTEVRDYRVELPGVDPATVHDLSIVAIDFKGKPEVYGPFAPGKTYGEAGVSSAIDWSSIRRQAEQRVAQLDAARASRAVSGGLQPEKGSSTALWAANFKVSRPGIQEVRYEDLLTMGVDLAGVPAEQIAVTSDGRPVAREIVSLAEQPARNRRAALAAANMGTGRSAPAVFGPGMAIRFWGSLPSEPVAQYTDRLVYRIEADASRALEAEAFAGKAQSPATAAMHWVREDADRNYLLNVPLDDPWYAALLRAGHSDEYRTWLTVDAAADLGAQAQLKVVLGGLSDYPQSPDHHVRIEVNGKQVADHRFDGNTALVLDLDVPAGILHHGANEVRIIAPGGTQATADLFVVDRIELGYLRRTVADNDRLLLEAIDNRGAGLRLDGLTDQSVVAYARRGDQLVRLPAYSFGRGSVQLPTLTGAADYWVSTAGAVLRPEPVGRIERRDVLAGVDADFLIIAHPAFVPLDASEDHPLNRFIAQRRAEGWRPALFDVVELQQRYSGGMPLPEAVTRFLADADRRLSYRHVLLVGGDSYDYRDILGRGSISFIPTRYAATRAIAHTPSDALLADLDGDGLSDKAVGRWPVRTLGDLEAIVTKTLDWDRNMRGAAAGEIWVADTEDPQLPSFTAQAERMFEPVLARQWPMDRLDRVYLDQVIPAPGASLADTARARLFELLAQGRALTGFIGHGSSTMWTFQGLLRPNDLAALHNVGKPTLVTTMACYTTYFVSLRNETLADRWMNGYLTDAGGQRIPGAANGAVALHGAATLSDYDQNERVARAVHLYLLDGQTLGEAVLQARLDAAAQGLSDQAINWILLGDPTLRMD